MNSRRRYHLGGLSSLLLLCGTGCSTLSDIGEGIYHNTEVYASRLDHSHDHQFTLLDGSTHSVQIAGWNHHQEARRMAPIFAVLHPNMVRSVERVLFWKRGDFYDEDLIGDAHYGINDGNMCLKQGWAPRHLVHETAHLYMNSIGDRFDPFEEIGSDQYEHNLGDPNIGLLSTKWSKNPINAKKGPFNGFISAYASNNPSECFAEILEYLFVIAHPTLNPKDGTNYYLVLSKANGTSDRIHHRIGDHDRRVQCARDIGALTDTMYHAYQQLIHPPSTCESYVRR